MHLPCVSVFSPLHVRVFLPFDAVGETAALVAHDGVDVLVDVAQHLGGRGSSATGGGNILACARAT